MKYTVYILLNKLKNKTYTGFTYNLKRRIKEHNAGCSDFTRKHGPWNLLYKEGFNDINIAMRRERYFKNCSGRKFIKKLLNKIN